jgi:nucleotide-binding universal stress UspA family protein
MNQPKNRRVLLPIDGSAHAQLAAEYLATCAVALTIGAVYVLNVQSVEEQAALAAAGEGNAPDFRQRGMRATATARAALDAANVANSTSTLVGEPAAVIVRAAEEEQVDEIVMGTRSKQRISDALGSVTYKVIHQASVPVTVVPAASTLGSREGMRQAAHRVLLAVDGSEHAQRAVRFVCLLHSPKRAVEVELVNVQPSLEQGYIRGLLSEEMLANFSREEREKAINTAADALRAAELKFNVHSVSGDVAERIVGSAVELQCTRIVMGTRGLGTIAGIALGSVAYKVIHLSSLPVTLVK